MLPPIPHPPGAPIEAFQPKSNPANRHMAMVLFAVAWGMVLGVCLFFTLRAKPKWKHTDPNGTVEAIAAEPHSRSGNQDSHPKGGVK